MRQDINSIRILLREFIEECVRQTLKEDREEYIKITLPDGTIMTFKNRKDYLKYLKNKKKRGEGNTNRGKRGTYVAPSGKELDPSQMYDKVQKLIKSAAPLESLYTFKEHSYRSYGTIANEMMQPFEKEYVQFSILYRKMRQTMHKIELYGKNDEYQTYNEALKLADQIQEMQIALVSLCDAVKSRKKEYKQKYGDTAAYNGRISKDNPNNKRELGFVDQLFSKSPAVISNTITNLYNAAKEIADLGNLGRNPLSYKID